MGGSRGACRRLPPTLADVAERAGVSRQTVSNAVNNPDLLRADTLARVQEAIDELGYSPNRAARNLRTRTSHLIGLRFTPGPGGHRQRAMDRFVHSLVETSSEAGYHVLLFAGRPRGPDWPGTTTCSARPRSTPSSSPTPTSATRRPPGCETRRAPFVAFGRPWDNPDAAPPVGRRRRRRRHRARHQPPARPRPRADRLDRLAQGLLDRRGPPARLEPGDARPRALHHRPGLPGRGHRRQRARGERGAARRGPARPAFVCASDTLAMGVLHTLAERGLRPGPRHRGRRLRRLPGRPGRAARAHLGAPAARGGRGRDRQGARGPARPPAVGPGVLLAPTLSSRLG